MEDFRYLFYIAAKNGKICVKVKLRDPTSSVVVGSGSELFDVIIKKIIANLFMVRVDDNYLRYVSFGKLKMPEMS